MDNCFVAFTLATHTGTDARQGLAPSARDAVSAIVTVITTFAIVHAGSSCTNRIADSIVDLILHCTVA